MSFRNLASAALIALASLYSSCSAPAPRQTRPNIVTINEFPSNDGMLRSIYQKGCLEEPYRFRHSTRQVSLAYDGSSTLSLDVGVCGQDDQLVVRITDSADERVFGDVDSVEYNSGDGMVAGLHPEQLEAAQVIYDKVVREIYLRCVRDISWSRPQSLEMEIYTIRR